jgi:hypothetical protein
MPFYRTLIAFRTADDRYATRGGLTDPGTIASNHEEAARFALSLAGPQVRKTWLSVTVTEEHRAPTHWRDRVEYGAMAAFKREQLEAAL